MHLRSIVLKGFKSFAGRTRLDFAPGVSVIVGPNGSGKSNVTDAIMWALGEQSALAVRGQRMEDVVFAGAQGRSSRAVAEVEVVIDNADGGLASEFSELSVTRRLERSGDGEYRLNGARCRLVDVLEALSDTGLGKEMHSIVSQGRVESMLHSKPAERRLLIEEAAGLGKHRKRRHRAELKLARTDDNLQRALDVEREARSHLKPLERRAQAAELHERLERQSLEARLELARDSGRATRAAQAEADATAAAARAESAGVEEELAEVARRREEVERGFAEQSRARELRSASLAAARSALERIELRAERAGELARGAVGDAARCRADAARLEERREQASRSTRVEELEAELAELDERRGELMARELEQLAGEQERCAERARELAAIAEARREDLRAAEQAAERARAEGREAERAVEAARRSGADARSELAAVEELLRRSGPPGASSTLAESLQVEPGYERALAAVLGPVLGAAVVADVDEAEAVLDAAGEDGATAVLSSWPGRRAARPATAPAPDAELLADRVGSSGLASGSAGSLAEQLLEDVWVVESLRRVPADFEGIAVTRGGRVLLPRTGELRQAPAHGRGRLLEEVQRRKELAGAVDAAEAAEADARAASDRQRAAVWQAEAARDTAEQARRQAEREVEEAEESAQAVGRQIARRRDAPEEGPAAVQRARLSAELSGERLLAERAALERAGRERALGRVGRRARHADELAAAGERAAEALGRAAEAVERRRAALERELAAGSELAERAAEQLRACSGGEVEARGRLKAAGARLPRAEVARQQASDRAAEAAAELEQVSARLGLGESEAEGGEERESAEEEAGEGLSAERRSELEARIERLGRRRAQIGPVNPLAGDEYREALEHVAELETRRRDLEQALAELRGLIDDLDRQIETRFDETFAAAAANFEEMVGHLFPGGRGRLRLLRPEGPRAVTDAETQEEEEGSWEAGDAAATEGRPGAGDAGIEGEVTPAGTSMRRLSLLSGGEKSLVALAFLFAVFLARPCPFYVLDEVDAALDDLNLERFLALLRRFSDRAQFIVVTHQKRTMGMADAIYGVSMGGDGVSKVVSRRLAGSSAATAPTEAAASAQPPAPTVAAAPAESAA